MFLFCRVLHNCHDDASKFIYLLAKPDCDNLEQEDFIPLLQVSATCSTVCGRGGDRGWGERGAAA